MGKTVKKLILNPTWKIGSAESWYSDMAKKGLRLKDIGNLFATFEKEEPNKTKYRVDVLSCQLSEEEKKKKLELYRKSGWEFVTRNQEFYIYSSPEEANCPELYTDPIEHGHTLTALSKYFKNRMIVISACVLLMVGMIILKYFFFEATPILAMVNKQWITIPLFFLAVFFMLYTVSRKSLYISRLRKRLLEGNSVSHQEIWKKDRLINSIIGVSFIIIAALGICMPFIEMAQSENYTIPDTSNNLPIIRLKDIEHNANLQRDIIYFQNGVDWGNRISYDWTLLAPIQYEVSEHGIIKNESQEGQGDGYTPRMEMQYYRLRFSGMATGLVHDLMEKYSSDKKVAMTKIESSLFSELFLASDGSQKQIYACHKNEIIFIDYYGNAEAEQIIALLASVISPKGGS